MTTPKGGHGPLGKVLLIVPRLATLSGVVEDRTNAPVAGAKLRVRNRSATADEDGIFRLDRPGPLQADTTVIVERGASLPVSGWQKRLDGVTTDLYLPPGHRLLYAAGFHVPEDYIFRFRREHITGVKEGATYEDDEFVEHPLEIDHVVDRYGVHRQDDVALAEFAQRARDFAGGGKAKGNGNDSEDGG